MTRIKIKYFLSLAWLLFTTAMVIWWWLYSLGDWGHPVSAENILNRKRMIFWEGCFFLVAIILGGFFLIYFLIKDDRKNKSLRNFFSTFSHDLKTSITRLRLQSEILREDEKYKNNKWIQRLVKDINRLDLQLENSLWLAQMEEVEFLKEEIIFSDLIAQIKTEFPDLNIEINQDLKFISDKRALKVIFSNLFQNSILHGKADTIYIELHDAKNHRTFIITDNGVGVDLLPRYKSIIAFSNNDDNNYGNYDGNSYRNNYRNDNDKSRKSSGIGLYLCRALIKKLNGELSLQLKEKQLVVRIILEKKEPSGFKRSLK